MRELVVVAAGSKDPRARRKLQEAQDAFLAAEEAKRQAGYYRAEQRKAMRRFDRFREDLESLGIRVVVESTTQDHPSPQGGTSDRNSRSTP